MSLSLYPDKTREELERLYVVATAALLLAATEKASSDPEQIVKTVNDWLTRSGDAALVEVIERRGIHVHPATFGKVH